MTYINCQIWNTSHGRNGCEVNQNRKFPMGNSPNVANLLARLPKMAHFARKFGQICPHPMGDLPNLSVNHLLHCEERGSGT